MKNYILEHPEQISLNEEGILLYVKRLDFDGTRLTVYYRDGSHTIYDII